MATAIDIKDQQRAQWREAADAWDQYFEWYSGAFAPLMTWCADAIGAAPGLRVLDVAAGSGQPSLTIAPRIQPGGTILGIDFSPEMVAVAERRARAAGATNVSFRTMDAEQLELPDATFDAVTCACGIIFFPDAQRALAEMRRVLTPGGRIAIGVWDEPSKSPFVTVGGGALGRFHAPTPPNPNAPGAFRFSKPDVLERVLRDAGFDDIRMASVPMPIEVRRGRQNEALDAIAGGPGEAAESRRRTRGAAHRQRTSAAGLDAALCSRARSGLNARNPNWQRPTSKNDSLEVGRWRLEVEAR
jgi:SAM-dependent methyltransferase